MRVCIVGASGKLGQYMVQQSLDRGDEVVGVCREQSVQKLDAFKGHMTVIPGATDDREVIKRAVAGCDGVAHGAGPARRAWVLDGNGQTAMSHESSEPGTHRSLSGLTRRTLMRRSAWVQGQLGQAFLNSAYVTAVSVSFILLFAVPAAFGFARLRLPLPAVLGLAILAPLMIPSEVILVPLFVMFRT